MKWNSTKKKNEKKAENETLSDWFMFYMKHETWNEQMYMAYLLHHLLVHLCAAECNFYEIVCVPITMTPMSLSWNW